MIKKDTEMLLFRYSTYRKYDFIEEHKKVLDINGHVWILKSGRKSNEKKIESIIENGGWLILKQPKADGGKYFLCHFELMIEDRPEDGKYPDYYREFIEEISSAEQWFKITSIREMPISEVNKVVLCKNEAKVIDVIGTTMTSVMFVRSAADIK